jgi:uncharacterized membrane protein
MLRPAKYNLDAECATARKAGGRVEIIVLRLIHVLGGIFWVGSGLFSTIFLAPAMAEAGAAAGAIMGSMQRRRMFVIMPVVALLTILSGLRLMWLRSAGFEAAYFRIGSGMTFAVSGAAAILAFLLGVTLVRPTMGRVAALAATMRSTQDTQQQAQFAAEMKRLQARAGTLQAAATFLIVLAAAGMAVARYMN